MDLKSIKGVEIFAAGKWNGDEYTEADLDEMVRAFNEDSQRKPPLKLGHDKGQKLLQKDGFPAAGWITNLYRQGSKLMADFSEIPAKIYDLIAKKAYRKVSSEVFWNIDVNGKQYKRKLAAVALLGGDMPAVNCLDDVLALYGVTNADRVGVYTTPEGEHTLKAYSLEIEPASENKMTEAEIKKLQDELSAERAKSEKAAADLAAKQKELDEVKQFRADAEKKAADAKLDVAVSELEKEHSLAPSVKTLVRELVGPEQKEYSLDAKGEKKGDKVALISQILKLHTEALKVNLKEHSQSGDEGDKKNADANKDNQELLMAKVQKYADENKVRFADAYKAVLKAEAEKSEQDK